MFKPGKTVLLGALALAYMGSALAAYDIVNNFTFSPSDLAGHIFSVGNSFGQPASGKAFSDTYHFDLSTGSQTVGTTVTVDLSLGRLSYQLSDMMIALTDSGGLITYASDTQAVHGDHLTLSYLMPGGSDYHFVVTGKVTGSEGGAYSGLLGAAAVPEADVYSMVLVGAGLIGLRLRSRIGAARRIYF